MALAKKNEFLDASDSEDEQLQNYDSDDDLRKGGRTAKRRKVDASDDELSDDDAEQDGGVSLAKDDDEDNDDEDDEGGGLDEEADGDDDSKSKKQPEKKTKQASELDILDPSRPLKKNLVATPEAIKKSGVVYLSRIPPFMKPAKLRSLLEPYGTINRIFLAPEDAGAHTRRVRAGGNKKRLYTEGWVEFVKKRHAKAACELLNARTIGGKKGSYYHDDLWNLLYLNGFKWNNLTEQIAAENAERASRMRAEISKTAKENREFVRNVERGKMLDGIQTKAKSKKRKPESEAGNKDEQGSTKKRPLTFEQTKLAKKSEGEQPENVTRVLSKIF